MNRWRSRAFAAPLVRLPASPATIRAAAVRRTFTVPRRFNPAYSLLGRALQRTLGDVRHAEAVFLVAGTLVLLGLLLGQYLAWALLKPAILGAPGGPEAVAFWTAQLGALAVILAVGIVGFRPAVAVTVAADRLHLAQGRRALTLAFDEIDAVAPVSAQRLHRHYARYAATHVFANRVTPEALLLQTAFGPVAVGLLPADHAALQTLLEARLALAFPLPARRVA